MKAATLFSSIPSRGLLSDIALAILVISVSWTNSQSQPSKDTIEVAIGNTIEITECHDHCWFPTIHRFRSGDLLVTMQMGADQADSEAEFSAYCISYDGGMTWSQRRTMGDAANADGAWTEEPDEHDALWRWGNYPIPAATEDDRNFYTSKTVYSAGGDRVCIDWKISMKTKAPVYAAKVALFEYLYNADPLLEPSPQAAAGTATNAGKSIPTDAGFQGEPPVADTRFTTLPLLKAWGNVIQGPQGELLSSGYYAPEAEVMKNGNRVSGWQWSGQLRDVVMRSLDGGKRWEEFGTIAALPGGTDRGWMGSEGPNEGSLALLSDGRLYAIFRTSGHAPLGNGWSADGGRTWTEPSSMGFQGVAPRLHRLHNGMLAFVTGRPGPVVLRLNPDGKGEHWSQPWTIYTGRSTCYADFTEVKPGRLLVVYDNIPYGWYQIPYADRGTKNKIFGTFVDVTDGTK